MLCANLSFNMLFLYVLYFIFYYYTFFPYAFFSYYLLWLISLLSFVAYHLINITSCRSFLSQMFILFGWSFSHSILSVVIRCNFPQYHFPFFHTFGVEMLKWIPLELAYIYDSANHLFFCLLSIFYLICYLLLFLFHLLWLIQ